MPFVLRETNEHPFSHLFLHQKVETLSDIKDQFSKNNQDMLMNSSFSLLFRHWPHLEEVICLLNLFGRWVISRYSKLIKKIFISLTTRKPQKSLSLSLVKIEVKNWQPHLPLFTRSGFFSSYNFPFSLNGKLCMTHFYESRFHHSFLFTFYSWKKVESRKETDKKNSKEIPQK